MNKDSREEDAKTWVRNNVPLLVCKFADPNQYQADSLPVTVFMAGSPGAGKTEFSIRLMENFKQPPVRIDADEIKQEISGYEGRAAHVFQDASSLGVERPIR